MTAQLQFPQHLRRPRRALWIYVLVALWAACMVGGLAALWRYKLTPGAAARLEGHWPAGTRLALAPDRPTLIMFAHPKCPCTRASIGELRDLLPRFGQPVSAYVVFLHPGDSGGDWSHTDSWASAAAIPGVQVLTDEDGTEATRFGAATSGHVVVYAPSGQLEFSGGITSARGHRGYTSQQDRLMAALRAASTDAAPMPVRAAGPVYGCPLEDPK